MKVIQIEKTEWNQGLTRSQEAYRLFGPVPDPVRHTSSFKLLTAGQAPHMDLSRTTLSVKSVVFPAAEVMFEYTTDPSAADCNRLRTPARDDTLRAVVGVSPYDAVALKIVARNFDTPEYRDPYFCDAYAACTLVGLAVNEPEGCDFSTSTGTGPFDPSGLDVLLVDDGQAYLAQVVTAKGVAWLHAAGFTTVAGDDAPARIAQLRQAAQERIESTVAFDHIRQVPVLDLHGADFWEDALFACINCGACTYVCPTCWCFDIQDENCGTAGKRFKNWDSCMFPLFTKHTTGHNPRGSKTQRTRQRFMHKLKYYQDKYQDGIMCVGCGRCIRACPVNIDIRDICARMNAA